MNNFQSAQQAAARRVLQAAWTGETRLSTKGASFLGQVSCAGEPLSDKQAEWLSQLADRAGIALSEGGSA